MRNVSDWNLLNDLFLHLNSLDDRNMSDDFIRLCNFYGFDNRDFLDNFDLLNHFHRNFNSSDNFNFFDDFLDDGNVFDNFHLFDNFDCKEFSIES